MQCDAAKLGNRPRRGNSPPSRFRGSPLKAEHHRSRGKGRLVVDRHGLAKLVGFSLVPTDRNAWGTMPHTIRSAFVRVLGLDDDDVILTSSVHKAFACPIADASSPEPLAKAASARYARAAMSNEQKRTGCLTAFLLIGTTITTLRLVTALLTPELYENRVDAFAAFVGSSILLIILLGIWSWKRWAAIAWLVMEPLAASARALTVNDTGEAAIVWFFGLGIWIIIGAFAIFPNWDKFEPLPSHVRNGEPCRRCSAPNRGTAAFCRACGAPLKAIECPRCRAKLLTGSRYCDACGVAVRMS